MSMKTKQCKCASCAGAACKCGCQDAKTTGQTKGCNCGALPRHVAVIGAAGGLGQGILDVCRTEGIGFTAIVRSRPERITNVPRGSRIAVVPSFTECTLLREAFSGADAVLTALGVTSTSHDRSALLSAKHGHG
jgi:hypothetical protein